MIQGLESNSNIDAILGSSIFTSFYPIFDMGNNKIGLAALADTVYPGTIIKKDDDNEDGMSSGAIAAIVILIIVIIAGLAALGYFLKKRRDR